MTLAVPRDDSERPGHPPAERQINRPFRSVWAFFADKTKEVLLDFANVRVSTNDVGHYLPGSNDWEYFREKWGPLFLRGEDDQDLFELVTELRMHWQHGAEELRYLANRLLQRRQTPEPLGRVKWVEFTDRTGAVCRVVMPLDLLRAMAVAILDLAQLLGYCPNPDCASPYFLRGRITQKFCDRPICTVYGQRQHKLEWWKEHGREWRNQRSKGKGRVRKSKQKR